MKRSEAARYARWSAAVAFLLAAITVGVYVRHSLDGPLEEKARLRRLLGMWNANPTELEFVEMEGDRKIFTGWTPRNPPNFAIRMPACWKK